MSKLRAYAVTHNATTQLTFVVAAHSAREALEKENEGQDIIEDWAGEAFPTTRPKARRAPDFDRLVLAASSDKGEPRP